MKPLQSVLSAKSAVKLIQRILTADYADNADVLRNEINLPHFPFFNPSYPRNQRSKPLFQEFLTADYADSADGLRNETSPIRLIREISGKTNPKNF